MRNECRALVRGTRLFISEKGCKDCSRATIPPARCSLQTRGCITGIIIRLMPCKLSGRERPFAWFYAHFSADADLRRRAAIIAITRRNDLVGFDEISQSSPCDLDCIKQAIIKRASVT